jgi:hypothetical protein
MLVVVALLAFMAIFLAEEIYKPRSQNFPHKSHMQQVRDISEVQDTRPSAKLLKVWASVASLGRYRGHLVSGRHTMQRNGEIVADLVT